MRSFRRLLPLLLAACSHTDSFTTVGVTNPPFTVGSDVLLTYNSDQDYWPIWTQDGQGILYGYVEPNDPRHRCVGLIAAGGGTRIWQMCRNSVAYADSSSSFPAYALDASGQLLYVEATTPFVSGIPAASQAMPFNMNLWLADTAKPFHRTALLTLPTSIAGISISWLGDIAWTGPNTFIALAQSYAIVRHCFGVAVPPDPACESSDTVLSTGTVSAIGQGAVVRGTIAAGAATLAIIDGTTGATGYSLAEGGASIIFSRRDESVLYKAPVAGGATIAVGNVASPLRPGYQVLGLSCFGTTCIAATDSATLTRLEPTKIFPVMRGGTRELRSISLTTGTSSAVASYPTMISSLAISPVTGDVVLQFGGMWGHLQTYAGSAPSDLHLLKGIVQ